MLTSEQTAVIKHFGSHAKVSAVAGAGKTTTMVHRVASLLARGVDPRRVLIVMFNKSARDEFDLRLKKIISPGSIVPEVRTFHSLGNRIAGLFEDKGFLKPARLETEEERLIPMRRQALRSAAGPGNARAVNDPQAFEEFLRFVEIAKSTLNSPRDALAEMGLSDDFAFFVAAFESLEVQRKERGYRTFADQLYDPCKLMQSRPATVAIVANKFDEIIVDEYQDINTIQANLLRWIAGHRAKVMVVGDPDQTIYTFRGAQPSFITHRFQDEYRGAAVYTLSRSFRFGHRVALLADNCISKNRERDDKIAIAYEKNPDTRFQVADEAGGVVPHLRRWQASGRKLSEAAILMRLFSSAATVELDLLAAGLPYRLVGAKSIFEHPIVLAILGYLHLSAGTLEQVPESQRGLFARSMLTQPPVGLGGQELQALLDALVGKPDVDVAAIQNAAISAAEWQGRLLKARASTIRLVAGLNRNASAASVIRAYVSGTDLAKYNRERTVRAETGTENDEIVRAFESFVGTMTVGETFDRLAQLQNAKTYIGRGDGVLITSVHRVKGLEFPLVIIVGLKDGVFPYMPPPERPRARDHEEDERRLFYVAVTRAQEQLVLLGPLSGAEDAGIGQPGKESRFLREAQPNLSDKLGEAIATGATLQLESEEPNVARRYLSIVHNKSQVAKATPVAAADTTQHAWASPPTELRFYDGQMVDHPFFGRGTITWILPGEMGVKFERAGHKTLKTKVAVAAGLRPA